MVQSITENADFEIALREQLDQGGPYALNDEGVIPFDAFLKVRVAIFRQGERKFAPLKQKMKEQRIEFFKAKNQQEYVKKFRETMAAHKVIMIDMTKKAAEHIGVDKDAWQKTMEKYMKDKETSVQIKKAEAEQGRTLEEVGEITHDKATIIKAMKFKMQRELQMKDKLNDLKTKIQPAQLPEIVLIETAKVSDSVICEFNFDMSYLMAACKHHNITPNEPELRQFAMQL